MGSFFFLAFSKGKNRCKNSKNNFELPNNSCTVTNEYYNIVDVETDNLFCKMIILFH